MFIPTFDSFERKTISPDALSVLCAFITGEQSLHLNRKTIDWHDVFEMVCSNGLIGIAFNYLKVNNAEFYPPREFQSAIKKAYEISALRMAIMHRNSANVLGLLNSAGISYRLVKGPVLAHTVYADPYARMFNDLDIFIRETDWNAVDLFLSQNGFSREDNDSQPPPHLIPQDVKQETHYLNKDKNFLIEIHYDDILNAGLATRDIDGFWKRSVDIDIFGVTVKTFDLEDQIIHLSTHLHQHGYSRLIWFSDLYLLLKQRGDQVNWQKLVRTVKIEETQTPVFYTFIILNKLLGVNISIEILNEIRPDSFRSFMHEKYWPLEKILSFQPLPTYYFSFYFIPLFRRLIPDFLVMGRRKEKLNYLFHLLFPSKDWLYEYYHLKISNFISFYFLLHPFRLLAIYLQEMIELITKKNNM